MLSAMGMMFSCDREEGVAVLRLEHGKVNAMDLPLCEALIAQLGDLAADSSGAVVLTGAGNAFSAGVDLVRLVEGGSEYVRQFLPAMDTLFHSLLTFPKPLVGALNGHALAGGCIIASCCDYVVMADGQGRVGVTELAVGVPFPMLPLEIVRARVTERDGRDLIFSARAVLPAEAKAMGLVDEVVPAAELLPRAMEAATRLSAIAPVTFGITKRAMVAPILARVRDGAAIDAEVTRAWQGDEVLSRVRAFLERRAKR